MEEVFEKLSLKTMACPKLVTYHTGNNTFPSALRVVHNTYQKNQTSTHQQVVQKIAVVFWQVRVDEKGQILRVDAYALNNLLKYTDPSGEIVIWDSWIVCAIDGFFREGGSLGDRITNSWRGANHRAAMDARIWGGLYASDPNKSFGGRVWEVVSRFTWQFPQTLGGFYTAHSYNTLGLEGGVESVDYKYGATVVKTRNDGWGGVTQGSYIVGDNSIEADAHNPLFQHEYGHYLQSQSMGWAYYPRVGIPSMKSEGIHGFHPVEQDANRRAFLYFNKNVDGFYDTQRFDGKGWDWDENPLDINKSGIRGQVVDYKNPADLEALNNIRVRAKWYDHASWLFVPFGGPYWLGAINSGRYNR